MDKKYGVYICTGCGIGDALIIEDLCAIPSDEGIGIPEDKLEKIFERFYQVDGSSKRRFGGTGLGLAIVQEIIHGHSGEITVESELGVGSTFRFTVPIASDKAIKSLGVRTLPDQ